MIQPKFINNPSSYELAKIYENLNTLPEQPFATRADLAHALDAVVRLLKADILDPDSHKKQEWGTPSDIGRMFGTTRERAADWLRKPAADGKIRMMRPNGDGTKGTYYNISDVLTVFAVKKINR